MKTTAILVSLLSIGLLAGCVSERHHECHGKKEHEHHGKWEAKKEAKLMREAKISKADAQATALAQVPNGTVKEAELEKEHGKLIWSFDITTPGSKEITEVNVDAISGKIVSKEHESPKKEKEEGDND